MNTFQQNKGIVALVALGGLVYAAAIALPVLPGSFATSKRPSGAPSPQQIATSKTFSVERNIRERCERKWGTDYRMIRYCIDQQTEAARTLGY